MELLDELLRSYHADELLELIVEQLTEEEFGAIAMNIDTENQY